MSYHLQITFSLNIIMLDSNKENYIMFGMSIIFNMEGFVIVHKKMSRGKKMDEITGYVMQCAYFCCR